VDKDVNAGPSTSRLCRFAQDDKYFKAKA